MVAIGEEILGLCDKMIREIGDFFYDSQSAKGSLKMKDE